MTYNRTQSFKRTEDVEQLALILQKWADNYSLPSKRVKACAYGTIVGIPDYINYDAPLSINLAKHELWIYAFDGFIDKLSFNENADIKSKIEFLDSILTQAIGPFFNDGKLSEVEAENLGLPLMPLMVGKTITSGSLLYAASLFDISKHFGDALHSLYISLKEGWLQSNPENLDFNLHRFTFEAAHQVGAMRQEIIQTLNWSQRRRREASNNQLELPSLEEYLAVSAISIAIPCLTTTVSTFEQEPGKIIKECQFATELVSRSVRLANDYGSFFQEIEEEKLTSVTLALSQLGYDLRNTYAPESQEISKARLLVKNWLKYEKIHFDEIKSQLSTTSLTARFLLGTQSSALQAYDIGDFSIPV